MIQAWRIVHKRYLAAAFDGEGARQAGGRFNSKGVSVVYAADALALAMLEVMVHVPSYRQLADRVLFRVLIDEELIEDLTLKQLPHAWQNVPAPVELKRIGDAWIEGGRNMPRRRVVMKVPSVILPVLGGQPGGHNYLINPHHPDFAKLVIGPPVPLGFDPRLLK